VSLRREGRYRVFAISNAEPGISRGRCTYNSSRSHRSSAHGDAETHSFLAGEGKKLDFVGIIKPQGG
jgi:hypothetical protein